MADAHILKNTHQLYSTLEVAQKRARTAQLSVAPRTPLSKQKYNDKRLTQTPNRRGVLHNQIVAGERPPKHQPSTSSANSDAGVQPHRCASVCNTRIRLEPNKVKLVPPKFPRFAPTRSTQMDSLHSRSGPSHDDLRFGPEADQQCLRS